MDDRHTRSTPAKPAGRAQIPTSAWLTFSLAFDDSTRLCRHIRLAHPDPHAAGNLIWQYLNGQTQPLAEVLRDQLTAEELTALTHQDTRYRCDQALDWLAQAADHHLLGLDNPDYPQRLIDTEDAPPLLYVRGSLDALTRPLVAVVGSRKASHGALNHTRGLCGELAQEGISIVSGLALGVDAAAHEGALQGGGAAPGPTIAVAATAPNQVYPKRHADLAQRIVDSGGLIMTEYPLGVGIRPWFFPRRNRIISGLSLGVLVAEAGLPSGTLTTADHAINQGREVMAVPGSVSNMQARGCHHLIKQGAALVENARDVIDTLGDPLQQELAVWRTNHGLPANSGEAASGWHGQASLDLERLDLSHPEQLLLAALACEPATIDELMTQSSWSVPQLASLLGLLEIRGLITTTAGGRYARC